MAFGVYVHIPYCLQRCSYCDFATYVHDQIMPPEQYIELVCEELRQKHLAVPQQPLDTLYFGGGTPSLLPSEQIVTVIHALAKYGFPVGPDAEVTIEINPATVDTKKLDHYLAEGINRFSVGVQTFDDPLLKSVHREHSAQQARDTIDLLRSRDLNFSFDLLFALPRQTRELLEADLQEVLRLRPPHISPYCLTVPEGHALAQGRPLEGLQLEMFEIIRKTLIQAGYAQYEISNFARPGFQSRHNSLYWDDQPYWGLGLGAHSYENRFGAPLRFWNPNSIGAYADLILRGRNEKLSTVHQNLSPREFEVLEPHQYLTDFCHTSLRRSKGLLLSDLSSKFGAAGLALVQGPIAQMLESGWLNEPSPDCIALTDSGRLVSNQVFLALTFLKEEWVRAISQP